MPGSERSSPLTTLKESLIDRDDSVNWGSLTTSHNIPCQIWLEEEGLKSDQKCSPSEAAKLVGIFPLTVGAEANSDNASWDDKTRETGGRFSRELSNSLITVDVLSKNQGI